MVIFSGLSGMFETVRAVSAPRKILSSSRKLMPLENVVWRSPDISAAAAEASPRNRHYGVCDLHDIIDLSEILMNPSVVPSKVHWQDADRSNQVEISHRHNRVMTRNPAFTSGFVRELTSSLTRIWLI